jgi:hypothetical protein
MTQEDKPIYTPQDTAKSLNNLSTKIKHTNQ